MVKWRIYYADGTTFDSSEGTPYDAPSRGVICIVQPDIDVGRHLVHRFDFYWWHDGEWYGGEIFGLFDYLASDGHKTVKFGRTISNHQYTDIIQRAGNDPDFPRKSAWRRDEWKVGGITE